MKCLDGLWNPDSYCGGVANTSVWQLKKYGPNHPPLYIGCFNWDKMNDKTLVMKE